MVDGSGLRLVAEQQSLSRSALGTQTGVVYFEVGDDFFPSKGWTDLAPDFAYAWLNGVMRIASGASRAETVFFMDGPYVIELTAKSPNRVDIHFIEDRPQRKIPRGFVTVPTREVLENAVSVLEEMNNGCQERGWQVDPAAVVSKLHEATDLLSKFR